MSGYEELQVHRRMLLDGVRNEAYRSAISHVVKPGDVVLDMGAGSGILSIFAAQAGARRVFAVERTSAASVARRMVEKNGWQDRIEVIESDLEDADLPEKVDVLVSEWMGGIGVDENMLAPLVMARDRWLKPGGTIIPGRVTASFAPISAPEYDDEIEYWRSRPHGVDMSVIASITTHETLMTQSYLTSEDFLAAPTAMWSHDPYLCTLEEADTPFRVKHRFEAQRAGKMSGLLAWFSAEMFEGEILTNAVGARDTHWGRMLLPLHQASDVAEGAVIEVEVRCEQSTPGTCEFYWAVALAGGPREEHDTRRGR